MKHYNSDKLEYYIPDKSIEYIKVEYSTIPAHVSRNDRILERANISFKICNTKFDKSFITEKEGEKIREYKPFIDFMNFLKENMIVNTPLNEISEIV